LVEEAGARTSAAPEGAGETDAIAAGDAGGLPAYSADAALTGIFMTENARDDAVVRGVVVFTGTAFILMNLLADMLYFPPNPRLI
jgi:hypothetical protein